MSNYKRLGDYIQLVDERNKELKVTTLVGLSISKKFIPSVANTVGTNMANYKIIRKNQFACSLMQVRRDKKIPVALLQKFDEAIISQAYPVFQVKDENELLPQYLMMWMSRSEFDRHACFLAVGGVRGSLEWDDLCDMELPIPSIEKQGEIVKEYSTIANRIKLNEQLNQKLEETAQALFKYWFVDFEFPNADGKPYKSSGGKMVYNAELDMEIPEGWVDNILETLIDFKNGKKKPEETGIYPIYGGNGILGYTNKFNYKNLIAVGRVGAYCGSLYRIINKCWISDNAIASISKNGNQMYAFDLLKSLGLNEKSEGTGQPLLTQGILNNIKISQPPFDIMEKYNSSSEVLFIHSNNVEIEKQHLKQMENLILSKMTKVETEKEFV